MLVHVCRTLHRLMSFLTRSVGNFEFLLDPSSVLRSLIGRVVCQDFNVVNSSVGSLPHTTSHCPSSVGHINQWDSDTPILATTENSGSTRSVGVPVQCPSSEFPKLSERSETCKVGMILTETGTAAALPRGSVTAVFQLWPRIWASAPVRYAGEPVS